jgi:hypothetical protein
MKVELVEKAESTVEEIQKSQAIRLVDVFLIAPYLFLLATKDKVSPLDKKILFGLGLATLLYNGANYLKNK